MQRGFTVFGIIGVIVLAIVVLSIPAYLWLLPALHDRTLNQFSQTLTQIQLPQNTQQIGELSKVGQQIANSDHCDYFAGVMVKTALPKEQFENYYRSQYTGKSELKFLWLDEESEYTTDSQYDPTVIHTLKDWVADKSLSNKANAVVYIFEVGMTSALDLRCS